jgi:hypothetical protein
MASFPFNPVKLALGRIFLINDFVFVTESSVLNILLRMTPPGLLFLAFGRYAYFCFPALVRWAHQIFSQIRVNHYATNNGSIDFKFSQLIEKKVFK